MHRGSFSRRLGNRAVAALEFAIIAPVLALLVIGVFDAAKGVILWQQVYNAAHSIPVSASTLSVQADKTTSLTFNQADQAMSSVYAEIPWIRDGIEAGPKSVTLSSVTFVPNNGCIPSLLNLCTYTPAVTWSVPFSSCVVRANPLSQSDCFDQVTRPCSPAPVEIAPTAAIPPLQSILTVLRTAQITQPDPILVADVHYRYNAFFFGQFIGILDFWATGYWSARTVDPTKDPTYQYTQYSAGLIAGPPKCMKPDGSGYWP